MAKLSLGVLASGSGSNFEAIARAIADGHLEAEIRVLIFNKPEALARQRAEKLGIATAFLDNRLFATREDLDRAIVDVLQAYDVDLAIMAGWMRVVTKILLEAFPDRVLNIHPSLLPSFKGMHAIEQALQYGVKVAGCTVHVVSLEVDSGKILHQAAVPVLDGDTVETLQRRIQVEEHRIYPEAIARYSNEYARLASPQIQKLY